MQKLKKSWKNYLSRSLTAVHCTSMLLERQKPTLYQQDMLEERAKIIFISYKKLPLKALYILCLYQMKAQHANTIENITHY